MKWRDYDLKIELGDKAATIIYDTIRAVSWTHAMQKVERKYPSWNWAIEVDGERTMRRVS